MTNNQYATFVKYLVEGDEDVYAPYLLSSKGEGGILSSQLKKIIDGAKEGGAKVIACMKAIYKQYGIASWQRLCEFVKALFAQGKGYMGKIYAKIGPAITAAINWVKRIIGSAANTGTSIFKKGIRSIGKLSIRGMYCIGFAACAIGAVLVKVGAVITNSGIKIINTGLKNENNNAVYRAYLNKRIDRVVMESKAMFSDLTQFTESVRMSEGPLDAIRGGVDKIFSGFSKIVNSFVDKTLPKFMGLWNKVGVIAKQNKALAIAITVCAACIFSFIGIRNHMASRKESSLEQTIESVIAKKAKKGSSAGKKLVTKQKAAKPVKAKSNIKTAVKKMASKKK